MAEHPKRFEIVTSAGTWIVRSGAQAEVAVRKFAELARSGVYEGTVFHRLVPGFVLQGGDPTGTGSGGGFPLDAELPDGSAYSFGTVALANDGTPGHQSAQFFVCLGDLPTLPPLYPVIGRLEDPVESLGQLKAWRSSVEQRPDPAIRINRVSELLGAR